jgi:hypothetical protein
MNLRRVSVTARALEVPGNRADPPDIVIAGDGDVRGGFLDGVEVFAGLGEPPARAFLCEVAGDRARVGRESGDHGFQRLGPLRRGGPPEVEVGDAYDGGRGAAFCSAPPSETAAAAMRVGASKRVG